MKLTKSILACAAATTLLAATVPASASTVAIADMNIFALGLFDATSGAQFTGPLSITSESRTGTAAANYNGVVATGVGAGSLTSNVIGASIDVQHRCAGDCGAGTQALYGGLLENNSTTHLSTPGTQNFAMGDMYISGSVLGGGISGLTRANAMTAGATNEGGANATILNTTRLSGTFVLGQDFNGRLGVGANSWLQTYVDSLSPITGSASAGFSWTMNISGPGGFSLTFTPPALNKVSFSTQLGENELFSGNGMYFSDAATFKSGVNYLFSINQSSNASVSEIPEPASLALVGLTLLAAGVARRRMQK